MAKNKAETSTVNIQAATLAMQLANLAAEREFAKVRFETLELPQFKFMSELEKDKLAFEKADAEAKNAMQQATLTGTYNGMPTLDAIKQMATLTGMMPDGGKTWQRMQDEAALTGYFNGAPTLTREQQQNNLTVSLMDLFTKNRGAANAFTQARLMNGTPQGMRDIINAVSGRITLPGFGGGSTQRPIAASLNDFVPNASGYAGMPSSVAGTPIDMGRQVLNSMNPSGGAPAPVDPALAGVRGFGPQEAAPPHEYQYQATGDGRFYTYPAGVEAPVDAHQYSSPTPLSYSALNSLDQQSNPMFAPGGAQGAADTADAFDALNGAPLPWQINSDAYNQLKQYGQDMLWGGYEDMGWDKGLAMDLYKGSLPTTGGPKTGTYR